MAIFVFKAARFAKESPTTANWEVKLLHPSQSLLRKGDIRKHAHNQNIKSFISAAGDFNG